MDISSVIVCAALVLPGVFGLAVALTPAHRQTPNVATPPLLTGEVGHV